MKDCVFCKIIDKELPASIIYEDELIIAFMDIQPVNPGHVLVVPKIHQDLIIQLDAEVITRLFSTAAKINNAIRLSKVQAEGINYFLADGEAAGQEIFHTHLHIFPRFRNDGFGLTFNEHYNKLPERGELDAISDDIRSLIG